MLSTEHPDNNYRGFVNVIIILLIMANMRIVIQVRGWKRTLTPPSGSHTPLRRSMPALLHRLLRTMQLSRESLIPLAHTLAKQNLVKYGVLVRPSSILLLAKIPNVMLAMSIWIYIFTAYAIETLHGQVPGLVYKTVRGCKHSHSACAPTQEAGHRRTCGCFDAPCFFPQLLACCSPTLPTRLALRLCSTFRRVACMPSRWRLATRRGSCTGAIVWRASWALGTACGICRQIQAAG